MKRKIGFFTILVTVLFSIVSCSNDDKSTGSEGTGYDSDSAVRIEDEDSKTDGETEQTFDFSKPVAENSMIVTFKGSINSRGAEKSEQGIGSFEITLNNEKLTLEDKPVTRFTEIGENGLEVLEISAFNDYIILEKTPDMQQAIQYLVAGVAITPQNLKKMKVEGRKIASAAEIESARLYEASAYIKKDGSRVVRFCNLAKIDKLNSNSKMLIENDKNQTFDHGEELEIKANIALTDDKTEIKKIYPNAVDDEGKLCEYRIGEDAVTKEDFEKAISGKVQLDCELPENFEDPFSESYLTFLFSGEINSPDTDQGKETPGMGDYTLLVDGREIKITDMGGYSKRISSKEKEYIALVSIGDYTNAGGNHVKFNMLEIDIPLDDLKKMKADGENIYKPGPSGYPIITTAEWKPVDGKMIGKYCPIAVVPEETTDSSYFICHKKNAEFAVGETYQIAANLRLTSDLEKIKESWNIDAPCYCIDTEGNTVDCSVME